MKTNRVLGKGLSALIKVAEETSRLGDKDVKLIALDVVGTNPHQPRKVFNDNGLRELADSIEQVGVLQPVLVRRLRPGEGIGAEAGEGGASLEPATEARQVKYCLVAGERRVRAARLAGMKEIPAIICSYAETEALKIALLENIQREDLSPIEEATAFQGLLDAYGATQEELAAMLGKNRSSVANALRLLTLEQEIQDMLGGGEITRGHAKALLGLPEGTPRLRLARLCRSRGLSVRDCEHRVQVATRGATARRSRRRQAAPETSEVRALRERAEQALGSPVRIERDIRTGKGSITIKFFADEDLERLLEIMGVDTDLS